MKNLKAWAQITRQLYIWHYNTNFRHYLMPFPDFDELAADIPMYHRHGVVGLFLEGAYAPGGGGRNGRAALLCDGAAAVGRQGRRPAGRRRSSSKAFTAALRRASPSISSCCTGRSASRPRAAVIICGFSRVRTAPYLEADFLASAPANCSRAPRQEAENDAVRRRVRKVRLSIDYVELLRSMAFEIRDGWYQMPPAARTEVTSRFPEFLREVRSFGIQQLHEGRGLEYDEKEFERRLRRYGVFTLENETLRVAVVPGLNGRIISSCTSPAARMCFDGPTRAMPAIRTSAASSSRCIPTIRPARGTWTGKCGTLPRTG
jgi:hypothetical protein